MGSFRVIPVLLLKDRRLVKTIGFKNPTYVGDTINALKIFSEKQVDELSIVDIGASTKGTPDFEYLENLVSECFMPLAYGGGIRTMEQANKLFALGIDKVILGEAAFRTPSLIREISARYGVQSVIVTVDVKKDWLGRDAVFVSNGQISTKQEPAKYAMEIQKAGAGEILLQSISRDGNGEGFDLSLITKVSHGLNIPVIALGGAGNIEDLSKAVKAGASAAAAGSLFVFKGPHRAVLISYPDRRTLEDLFKV